MKSFDGVSFKIELPMIIQNEDYTSLSFRVIKKDPCINIVYAGAMILDVFRENHCSDVEQYPHFLADQYASKCVDSILHSNQKRILLKKASLTLLFWTEEGIKVIVYYIIDGNKSVLTDVSKQVMTDVEKIKFSRLMQSQGTAKKSNSANSESTSDNWDRRASQENEGIKASELPEMKTYIDALNKERDFLKAMGGKQYNVSNGRYLGLINGHHTYSFELENELYLADDSPVTLLLSGIQYEGTVLLCEDFQIIIQLKHKIGDKVLKAKISAAPWKLLDALKNRLNERVHLKPNKITKSLSAEGPGKATKDDISKVPKGQEAVIDRAMNESVTIVWGPPGTGKTYTMSQIAIKFLEQGKSVLIVSHSNVSVDGVATKIYDLLREQKKSHIFQNGKVLRYGYVRDEELRKNQYISSFKYTVFRNPGLNAKLERLQEEFDELKKKHGDVDGRGAEIHAEINKIKAAISDEEHKYVANASIVATTISKVVIDHLFDERMYDVVMFDEVSMAYVPQVICAATYAKEHFICVGDFWQLAPIAQSEAKSVLENDIFMYLGIMVAGKAYYHPWLVMLNEQRRMDPIISEFPRKRVYSGLLLDHDSVIHAYDHIIDAEPFAGSALNFIDLSSSYCAAGKDNANSRFNILSAIIMFATAIKAEKNVGDVSIITPYVAQTRLIRAMILDYRANHKDLDVTHIRCATVHQFQGSESNVVLFDAVESFPAKRPGWLLSKDYKSIKRLINVAVTRPHGKLVTIANGRFWDETVNDDFHLYYKLQKHLRSNGNVTSLSDTNLKGYIQTLDGEKGVAFFCESDDYKEILIKDVLKAQHEIIISLPNGEIDLELSKPLIDALHHAQSRNVTILSKTNDFATLDDDWKKITWGTENAIFPIIMIDQAITWYGAPKAKWMFDIGDTKIGTACHIACRICGRFFAEMICAQTNLKFRQIGNNLKELSEKREDKTRDDGMNPTAGFAAFISEKRVCPKCKNHLTMVTKSNPFLWCKSDKLSELISPEEVNLFISNGNVTCPQDGGELRAGVGRFGLFVRCSCGHYVKLNDLWAKNIFW